MEFSSRPDDYILEIAEKAKLSPELIHLLKLHQQFSSVSSYSEVSSLLCILSCESNIHSEYISLDNNKNNTVAFSVSLVVLQIQPGETLLIKPITKCDSGTQTDTHPVETNIVKSYKWNEWELRRKAIKMVNKMNLQDFFLFLSIVAA